MAKREGEHANVAGMRKGGLNTLTAIIRHDNFVAELAAARNLAAEEGRRALYAPAQSLLMWGEKQGPRHAEPLDIFACDLVLVAAIFTLGDFLKDNVDSAAGLVGLFGMGLTLVNTWSQLLFYRARFEAASAAHRILDLLEGLAAAAAAHNIEQDLEVFEAYNQYVFLGFVLMGRGVQLLRRFELYMAHIGQDNPIARATVSVSIGGCKRLIFEMLCLSVGFFFQSFVAVMSVLIATWAIQVTTHLVPVATGLFSLPKHRTIPIHVEFYLNRMGELVMLTVGEGVLSLVLARTTIDYDPVECDGDCLVSKSASGVSFASAFLLFATITYQYFR